MRVLMQYFILIFSSFYILEKKKSELFGNSEQLAWRYILLRIVWKQRNAKFLKRFNDLLPRHI